MLQNVQFRVLISFLSLLLLGCHSQRDGEVISLQISKVYGQDFIPIFWKIIEENAGANFSLHCELVCSLVCPRYRFFYNDPELSWITSNQVKDFGSWLEDFTPYKMKRKEKYWSLRKMVFDPAIKYFRPLKSEDGGEYFCLSLKHKLIEVIEIRVKNTSRPPPSTRPPPPTAQEKEYVDMTRKEFVLICISGIILVLLFFLILGSRAVVRRRIPITNSRQPINLGDIGLNTLAMPLSCDLFINQHRRSPIIQFNCNNINPSNPAPPSCQYREAPALEYNHISHHSSGLGCGVSNPPLHPEEDPPPSYFEAIRAQNPRVDWNNRPPPYTSQEDVNALDDKN